VRRHGLKARMRKRDIEKLIRRSQTVLKQGFTDGKIRMLLKKYQMIP